MASTDKRWYDGDMTKEEVLHLSELARIELTEVEIERLPNEIAAIVEYVGTIKEIIGTETVAPSPGARYNVLRPDIVTHEPGTDTETLLAAAPRRQDDFLVVNKIIQQSK